MFGARTSPLWVREQLHLKNFLRHNNGGGGGGESTTEVYNLYTAIVFPFSFGLSFLGM